jgi:membrane protein
LALISRFWRFIRPTIRYWMETEVHVYCFSVAANVILSFFPFLIVMVSICQYVFRWDAAIDAIFMALADYLPGSLAEFVERNLRHSVKRLEWVSLLLLLFTANGVFEPLEVALNRVWGITTNRSYFRNQLISFGLIFVCGSLTLLSATATALNQSFIHSMGWAQSWAGAFLGTFALKVFAVPVSILTLFLIYWLLPNGKVPRNRIIAAAISVGLLLEVLKYLQLLIWPWLDEKLGREYGPFRRSVAIILFSFFASMLVLAGAEWAARRERDFPTASTEPAIQPDV